MKPLSILLAYALISATTQALGAELGEKLATIMQRYHSQGQFMGSVLVAHEEEVVYQDAFGMANIESDLSNQADTRFRIASITKGFTATLVLQAAERGELELQQSIQKYLPELTNQALADVTLEHLLTHTSGIEDFAPRPMRPGQSVCESLVEQLNQVNLSSKPGEVHKYCNVGYTILGLVLENATGSPYEALLSKRVFEPLAMESSYLEGSPGKDYATRAQGYAIQNGQLESKEEADLSLFPAAGGIVSTAPDLLRFSRGLAGTELINQNSRERMLLGEADSSQYGCLNRKIPTGDSVQIFQGGMSGTASVLVRVNDGQYTIVLLSNQTDAPCQPIARHLLMTLLQK